jgi:menaquinone-dependent protoporphyrinogen IX oxidase
MRVGIVRKSLFGDTREIAEAIAAGIREADPAADLACSPAAEADPHLAQADLLIVGAPTHILRRPGRLRRRV